MMHALRKLARRIASDNGVVSGLDYGGSEAELLAAQTPFFCLIC
jgi:hypothetical protein